MGCHASAFEREYAPVADHIPRDGERLLGCHLACGLFQCDRVQDARLEDGVLLGELRLDAVLEALHAGDLPDELRGDQDPAAALGKQLGSDVRDEYRELARELVDCSCQLADTAQLITGDPHAGRLLSASEATGDALLPANGAQSASGDLELGPRVVEVPAQVVSPVSIDVTFLKST